MTTQWQLYQTLELIPPSVPEPVVSHSPIVNHWGQLRLMLTARSREKLTRWQQVDWLERCYVTEIKSGLIASCCRGIWAMLNRPLFSLQASPAPEPQVWQTVDWAGHLWWHVYDPSTGSTADLESEEEVQIWLEEHR